MSEEKLEATQIPEPKLSLFLFADARLAWFWLIVRFYVGWQWLSAGWIKVQSSTWTGSSAGQALQGFIMGALKKADGAHPDVYGWYGGFLSSFVLHNLQIFAFLIAYGELLVGIALILGIFTGIAAFFGAFMNMNYLFAGTISINPLLFLLELFLILAWRVAGAFGVDRFLLPWLGTPWYPGKVFQRKS